MLSRTIKGCTMEDYQRRLAAARAELEALGLRGLPHPIQDRVMRLFGGEARPWPYLPLGVRMSAYAIPYAFIWTAANFFLRWKDRPIEPGEAVVSTVMTVALFSMLMLGYELRRWQSVKLSRWEDL
ncbi:DUF6404 family protein [Rhodobacter viridis]|nr:DUF6404 family protein [Rhodobacter viridis]